MTYQLRIIILTLITVPVLLLTLRMDAAEGVINHLPPCSQVDLTDWVPEDGPICHAEDDPDWVDDTPEVVPCGGDAECCALNPRIDSPYCIPDPIEATPSVTG